MNALEGRRVPRVKIKYAALLLALAAGVTFRLWNLRSQILSEDEMHSVQAALAHPISKILVTYQRVDNCIPMTALDRLLMDRGVRLTEMTLRLPVLLSGMALLFLAPFWVVPRLGWGSAVVFAALLAISPGLVFYSRIGRPYGPIVLFAFGALAAFESWWRGPQNWRLGAAYVLLASLAVWFHLGAAPFVVSPLLFAVGDLIVRKDFRKVKSVMFLGLATVAAFLAFLLPARQSLVALVKEKHAAVHLTGRQVLDVLELHSGSGQRWVMVLFWAAATVGLARLFRLNSRLAALSATAVLGHVAGLFILAPVGSGNPAVFFRYVLVVLPWLLLWVAAIAASGPSGNKSANRFITFVPWGAAVLLLLALFLTGPFMDRQVWRDSFAHHYDSMIKTVPQPRLIPEDVPPIYDALAVSKEPGAVLEYPWAADWHVNRAFFLYQELHKREIVVGGFRGLLNDRRLAFRNEVAGTPEAFLTSRARWLIVHRDVVKEENNIPPPVRIERRFRLLIPAVARRTIAQLTGEWGKPDASDRWVAVWDLARVRKKILPSHK